MAAEPTVVKKRPGRPPSKQAAKTIVNLGIVSTPIDPDNVVEIKHTNVTVFTSVFAFFDKMNAVKIYVNFTPTSMVMFCRNETKPLKSIISINVNKLHRYFCKDPCQVHIKRDSFSKAFHSSDKNIFDLISISKSKMMSEKIDIEFHDPKSDRDCTHEIELSTFNSDDDLCNSLPQINPEKYPLTFTLPSVIFKKTVVDIEKITDTFSYEYMEGKNTILKVTAPRPGYNYKEKFENSKAIKLVSTLKPKDIIDCPIKISNIKPLISAISAAIKTIKICINEEGETLFITKFDGDDVVVANTILSTSY